MDSGSSIRKIAVDCASSPLDGFALRQKAAGQCLLVFIVVGACAANLQAQQPVRIGAIAAVALPDAPGFGGVSQPAAVPGSRAAQPAAAAIAGTVVDTNGDVVQGAEVVLTGASPADRRATISGANGQFTFSGLPPETYQVMVTGHGMGTVVSPPVKLTPGEMRFLPELVLPVDAGVTVVRVFASQKQIQEQEAEIDVHIEESQRVLGVIPNFYSAFDWNAPPLNARQKFSLAFRSEIDPVTFAGAAGVAAAEEYKNIYPAYGVGFAGFGKRFAAQYANDFDSRMIGSALLPSLFHQDPRFFYKGTGTVRSRVMYSITSAFICRGDNGKKEFDFSHILGNVVAGGLANLYYPESNEGPGLVFTNSMIEVAGMAGTNLLREFVLRGITSHVPRPRGARR
jgi:hypothetical protein